MNSLSLFTLAAAVLVAVLLAVAAGPTTTLALPQPQTQADRRNDLLRNDAKARGQANQDRAAAQEASRAAAAARSARLSQPNGLAKEIRGNGITPQQPAAQPRQTRDQLFQNSANRARAAGRRA